MKLPVLTTLLVFIAWLTVKLSQGKKEQQQVMDEYWKKEEAANAVRRQSLDDLNYISFPFSLLPDEESFTSEGQNIPSSLLMLKSLQGKKIVNLNNISNTDLKLRYGTTNITTLTEFDENFITLCREGHLFTEYLYDTERLEESKLLSEALIKCGSDVSSQYTLLWKIYDKLGLPDKKLELKLIAEGLESSRKNSIIKALTALEEEPEPQQQ